MARILSKLLLEPTPGRQWRVVCPFAVETDAAGILTVPADFVCNLNSIPRVLWWASTPADFPEAGVVHDYLYRTHATSQATADAVYYEMLRALGMGTVRARARYCALRVFGRRAYRP